MQQKFVRISVGSFAGSAKLPVWGEGVRAGENEQNFLCDTRSGTFTPLGNVLRLGVERISYCRTDDRAWPRVTSRSAIGAKA